MWRSCCGKRVARTWTSAVREDPSGVLVKLKNGMCEFDLEVDESVWTDRAVSRFGVMGERGDKGETVETKCFEGDVYNFGS